MILLALNSFSRGVDLSLMEEEAFLFAIMHSLSINSMTTVSPADRVLCMS